MNYWRMQLHPNEPEKSVRYACESLVAGFIGLDFRVDPGDLEQLDKSTLPDGQQDYWDFANTMKEGDLVLVMAHHFPVALTQVAGPYNYIKHAAGELGVWFRHFREIDRDRLSFYADYLYNAHEWQHITMTDTLSSLSEGTQSRDLMEDWASALGW